MYEGLTAFLKDRRAIVERLPKFVINEKILYYCIAEIKTYSVLQNSKREVITSEKKALRATLIQLTNENSRKLNAYAHLNNNLIVQYNVTTTKSSMSMISSIKLLTLAMMVHKMGEEYLAELAEYQIDVDSQKLFGDTIENFYESIGETANNLNQQTLVTKRLGELFDQAANAIKAMSVAVDTVCGSNPAFYNDFKKASRIGATGLGTLAVRGFVTNAETGKPIKGVKLTFTAIDDTTQLKGNVVLQKTSAVKGGFVVKNLPKGIYLVTAVMYGYATAETVLVISDNRMQVLNMKLSKN